jgi:hypothetical protein
MGEDEQVVLPDLLLDGPDDLRERLGREHLALLGDGLVAAQPPYGRGQGVRQVLVVLRLDAEDTERAIAEVELDRGVERGPVAEIVRVQAAR